MRKCVSSFFLLFSVFLSLSFSFFSFLSAYLSVFLSSLLSSYLSVFFLRFCVFVSLRVLSSLLCLPISPRSFFALLSSYLSVFLSSFFCLPISPFLFLRFSVFLYLRFSFFAFLSSYISVFSFFAFLSSYISVFLSSLFCIPIYPFFFLRFSVFLYLRFSFFAFLSSYISVFLSSLFCLPISPFFFLRFLSSYLSWAQSVYRWLRARRPGCRSLQGQEIFLFPITSSLWIRPSLLSNGYQGIFPGVEAAAAWNWPLTCFWCRGQECRTCTSTPPPPIRLHGIVLSVLSPGITFPFYLKLILHKK
jgi:hypothetical protein